MATEGTSSFNHLPNDTVRAILSWLPVKSLLKLRSVSKSWNTIISDRMHLQRQQSGNLFLQISPNPSSNYPVHIFSLVRLMNDGSFQFESINLKGPRPSYGTIVLSSCEGVLLLTNDYSHNSFMLWNPSTRAKTFFRFPYRFEREQAMYGLCHDPTTGDFKAVLAYDNSYAVYSGNNKSWTQRKDFRYGSWLVASKIGTFADGLMCWLANNTVCKSRKIIYFDPRDDDFKMLEKLENIVKEINNGGKLFCLVCLSGCLCLCCHVRLDKTEFRIWKKEKGGDRNTWNERMVIENEKPLSMSFRPVCLLENNKILFQFVEWGRFLACSPCEKTFEKFADINHDPLSQDKLFLCRESMMLNVENLRRPKRKLSEPLELKTFIFPTEVSFT